MQWADILRVSAAFALILTAIAITYALIRAGGALRRAENVLERLEGDLPRLLAHGDATLGKVDDQLDQVERVLRTTADGMERADRAVRRVGQVVEAPVGALAGASAYARGAVSGLRHRRGGGEDGGGPVAGIKGALDDGRRAADELARELDDELRGARDDQST